MKLSNFAVYLFLGMAIADANGVQSAMDVILQKIHDMNDTLRAWDGGIMNAMPLLTKSMALVDAIHNASDAAKNSQPFTEDEGKQAQQKSQSLIDDGRSTLDSLVAAKPKFGNIPAGMFIKNNIAQQKDASTVFSMRLMDLMPAGQRNAAKDQVNQLDGSFDAAMKAYAT